MLGIDSMIPKDGRGFYPAPMAGGYLGPYPGQQMRQPFPCDMFPTNLSQENFKCKELTGIPILDGKDDNDRPLSPPLQRERFSYTRYQLELLNGIYTRIRYPNSYQKQLIAKRVGITRDQVKIWFQNRRRKDVIAAQGKSGNKSPESDTSDSTDPVNKMVPQSIMESVLSELVSFENDPKGKKLKAQIERQSHRARPYNISSRRGGTSSNSGSNRGSPTSGDITPPMLSPQNASDLSASPIDAFYQQSPESNLQSPNQTSPHQDLIPSSLQLDMVAPPNAVAPPNTLPTRPPRLSTSPEKEDDEDNSSPVQPFTTMAYPYYIAAPNQPYPMSGVDTDGRPIPFDRVFPIPLVADPSTMLSAMPNFNPDMYSNALKGCQPPSGMRIRDPYQPIFMTPYNNPHHMRNSTTGPCNRYTAL